MAAGYAVLQMGERVGTSNTPPGWDPNPSSRTFYAGSRRGSVEDSIGAKILLLWESSCPWLGAWGARRPV